MQAYFGRASAHFRYKAAILDLQLWRIGELKTAETWFSARLFILQSSIICQILEFIYWTVTIFSFDHMTDENRELTEHELEKHDKVAWGGFKRSLLGSWRGIYNRHFFEVFMVPRLLAPARAMRSVFPAQAPHPELASSTNPLPVKHPWWRHRKPYLLLRVPLQNNVCTAG